MELLSLKQMHIVELSPHTNRGFAINKQKTAIKPCMMSFLRAGTSIAQLLM